MSSQTNSQHLPRLFGCERGVALTFSYDAGVSTGSGRHAMRVGRSRPRGTLHGKPDSMVLYVYDGATPMEAWGYCRTKGRFGPRGPLLQPQRMPFAGPASAPERIVGTTSCSRHGLDSD